MQLLRLPLAIVFALWPFENFGQQPGPQATGVFRVSSTLVQVDAVVTDAKGRQVTDLTAADFDLYADGKLQKITSLSYVAVTSVSAPVAKVPLATSPPVLTIKREDVRRTLVLMVDDLNLSFESLAFVRASLLKFIDQQMQPGDLVAVCKTGAGSSALQQFTSDRRLARSIVSGLRWNPNGLRGASFLDSYVPDSDLRTAYDKAHTGDVRQDSFNQHGTSGPAVDYSAVSGGRNPGQLETLRRNTMTAGALGAIDYVIQALRDMPGRKSVILFSDGFSLEHGDDNVRNAMRQLVDRANRSGTAVYTMHAAGLQVLLPTAGDNPNLAALRSSEQVGEALNTMTRNRSEEQFSAQAGLDYLARVTGGFAYSNSNDLNFGLEQIMEDQRGYYLLSYSPPSGTFDEKGGGRIYHKLSVAVKGKGLTIRSRSGFFGATDEETKPQYSDTLQQLHAAMLSPFGSSGVRLRLTPLYTEVAGHGPVIRNLVDVDTRDLKFQTQPDGSASANLKLVVAAYGVDNKLIKIFGTQHKFIVPMGKMQQAERDGVLYTLNIELPKPGGVQIRAAVLDEATGKTGSAHEYLEIPDVRKRPISLTSLVLADSAASGGEGVSLGASAARRQFQPGGLLEYFCLVANREGKDGQADQLNAQLRIVRGDKQMLLMPVKIKELVDHTHTVSGQLKLGSGLLPGDYFVQVVVSEGAGRKPAVAEEWTDFEIVR